MELRTMNIHRQRDFKRWQQFLEANGIHVFNEREVRPVEQTFGWFDNHQLVATGSVAGNVLKYIAIAPDYQENGATFNTVVSQLVSAAAQQGQFHLMVFTKPQYVKSFQYVGFTLLAQTEMGAVLETGMPTISTYLKELPRVKDQQDKRVAGIVMNANPFTKGHRFLVEQASRENDVVYVFVVSQDASLFTTAERTKLVQAGTADLKNVLVVPGKEYMVSGATFPAYFLKDDQNVGRYQAALDATLFKEQVAPALNITARYLGSEPYSKTTEVYNKELHRILPPEIAVRIIDRTAIEDGTVVTATKVRAALAAGDEKQVARLVPSTTMAYVKENWDELRQRAQERMRQNGD